MDVISLPHGSKPVRGIAMSERLGYTNTDCTPAYSKRYIGHQLRGPLDVLKDGWLAGDLGQVQCFQLI